MVICSLFVFQRQFDDSKLLYISCIIEIRALECIESKKESKAWDSKYTIRAASEARLKVNLGQ